MNNAVDPGRPGRTVDRAAAEPDRLAITGAARVSYRQLVELVAETAAGLPGRYGPGDVLAVCAPTSPAGLVAILTALRLGAAFLPVDPVAPPARQAYLLRDAGAVVVLHPDPADPLRPVAEPVPVDGPPQVPPEAAYIMYTSGSTGRPKGVLVSERSLLARLDEFARTPGFRPGMSSWPWRGSPLT